MLASSAASLAAQLGLGLALSSLIGVVAYRRRALSRSGVWGAILIGTLIFGFGGWTAGLLLIAFFVSSSALSHFKERDPRKQRAAEMFEKGGQRDWWQALANGGAAAALAVGSSALANVEPNAANALFAAMVGALATVNADTWATELGVLSPTPPRRITRLSQVVVPGTSGGITAIGTLAALSGALFIGVLHALLGLAFGSPLRASALAVAGLAALGGLGGALFDSMLGATVQAMYYSERRQKETEKPFERDGTPNRHVRGWRWMNNDWVNFLASLFGAALTAALWLWTQTAR
ncbi:MAG: DUF92 domain-containing protein [Thermoflexales bacterium]|nr:DUF92 domain-containing protein [Thermoflexales bacterium]MCS7324169.1 DUF92 domain-containing protein [Thermoflexales bacterium]MCX7940139.1 DUF92 domain-containing protein [Thermoflexales bacterium]MDW8053246.1 DUF92 domain-containing protein [Anaerolineae bacterium]MDW8291897.1 DUF92 domain-containing protein [Anaerolineae bacterium]